MGDVETLPPSVDDAVATDGVARAWRLEGGEAQTKGQNRICRRCGKLGMVWFRPWSGFCQACAQAPNRAWTRVCAVRMPCGMVARCVDRDTWNDGPRHR